MDDTKVQISKNVRTSCQTSADGPKLLLLSSCFIFSCSVKTCVKIFQVIIISTCNTDNKQVNRCFTHAVPGLGQGDAAHAGDDVACHLVKELLKSKLSGRAYPQTLVLQIQISDRQ